jgi:uncharacterized membrane protein YphA (DoxX/SURF4 family)
LLAGLRRHARQDGAYLVPLRLFIGIGWLRAAAEKAADPGWFDGASLTSFLTDRLQRGDVALPPYETLIGSAFLPSAVLLAWLILVGQTLVGLGILCGACTNAALVGGLFMNLNFLLAGEPTPSAFYIVIQVALICAGTGSVLGLDAWLVKTGPLPGAIARLPSSRNDRFGRRPWLGAPIAGSLAVGGYALTYVRDWSPAGSVHDPAMILAVLAFMVIGWLVIIFLRLEPAMNARSKATRGHQVGNGPVVASSFGHDLSDGLRARSDEAPLRDQSRAA